MTSNLIGPDGKYPTPFQSYLGNITDSNHNPVLVPHISIGFDDANNLGEAFVEAANAYYGKPGGFAAILSEKNAKITEMTRLYKNAWDLAADQFKDDLSAKNARIAELDIELAGANGLIKTLRVAVSSTEKERDDARTCAEAAEVNYQNAVKDLEDAEKRVGRVERALTEQNHVIRDIKAEAKGDLERMREVAKGYRIAMNEAQYSATAYRKNAEEVGARVKELESERNTAGFRGKNLDLELADKDARIAQLDAAKTHWVVRAQGAEKRAEEAEAERDSLAANLDATMTERDAMEVRAEKAEARVKELKGNMSAAAEAEEAAHAGWTKANEGKEAAERHVRELETALNWYRGQEERAEEAEARVKRLEATLAQTERSWRTLDKDRWQQLNRAEDAEVRVGELEPKLAADPSPSLRQVGEAVQRALAEAGEALEKSFQAAFASRDAAQESYVAPDGRVFRVGQRVQSVLTGNAATVTSFEDGRVHFEEDCGRLSLFGGHPEDLRRVWDGTEEDGLPDGVQVKDRDGDHWWFCGGRWYLWNDLDPSLTWVTAEPPAPRFAPFVEHLEVDE